MEPTISNAFLLLVIGMITVFIVLSLVVLVGNLLIKVVNKIAKDPIPPAKLSMPRVSNKKLALLAAVVHQATEGRGTIEKVERIK